MDQVKGFFSGLMGKTPKPNSNVRPPRNTRTVNNKSHNVRTRVPLNTRTVNNKSRNVRTRVPFNVRYNARRPYYGGKKKHGVMTKQTRKVDGVTRVVRRTKTGRRYVLLHGHRKYL